jgi:hypothetical protein
MDSDHSVPVFRSCISSVFVFVEEVTVLIVIQNMIFHSRVRKLKQKIQYILILSVFLEFFRDTIKTANNPTNMKAAGTLTL